MTKLFQHKDVHLRRMVYLVIKEVIPSSDEVIIITSRCAHGALLLGPLVLPELTTAMPCT